MKLPCLPAFASSAQVLVALLLAAFTSGSPARSQTTLAPSDRVVINLGQTQWRYMKDSPTALPANPQSVTLDDSKWQIVGLPYSTNQAEMFQNQQSGGGDGNMPGNVAWYRHHFTMAPQYAGKKVLVEFEGVHTGAQVWINGTFLPGNSVLNPQATHVVGFVGFMVDITPYLHFDGTTDNVLAVSSAKNASWFESPNFSQGFRFGQADSGIFRPVTMYITDKIHIPQNTAAGLGTWGTYVATLAASDTSATVEVQTNVLNEGTSAQAVTLTTQIVDAAGNVVATNQDSKVIPANAGPGLTPTLFDETLTVANPTLWYPNNSIYGKPYMYKVFHTLSMNGVVIDAVQSPLGIRTLTWDKNVPYFNGKAHFLWGGSGRYDYPALGTSVPAEQEWRDLQQIAAAGGSLWRPGHSSQSPEFLDAADAYGVMVVQPSGDGENGFANPCDPTCDKATLKKELHRDMILRDRNHPSILAWEADNGITDTTFAQSLKALSLVYDPIAQHVQADRTPNPANGDILGCTLEGCEVGVKNQYPNSPAWGSEYWGTGTARQSYDYELAFAAPFLDNWRKGRVANAFGMAQWYFADSPGETSTYVEGTPDASVRSLGASMVDMNRFPKMLYKIYQAAWVPYQIKPVVSLAHHWNRAGNITVNAFSNCPAVRLLINGVAQGADQVPNPWTTDGSANLTQTTTNIAGQVHWNVTWAAGTVTAECLDAYGNVKATDSKTTAGQPDHIELDVVPELVKPDGTAFQITANGSDAAFIVAKVVDANGVVVPTASNNITFAVNGPGTYQGGSEQLVTAGQPYSYHAPFDPELQAEGGLTKIVVRSQFTSGTVTVTATSPGLGNGTASYAVAPVASTAPTAAAPAIIAQPTNTAVTAGQPATFSVTASGAATLLFQWKKNGVAIAGANSATYTTPATSLADNGATFSVVISNSLGSASSSAATLTVVAAAAPAITAQPVSLTATVGQTATFSVTATGSPTLTYQWRKNGTPIAGAIYPSYTTPVLAATDNGEVYTVVVTNPVNAATSAAATLTVNAAQAPVITTQPANTTGIPGQPANLTVAVSGSTPMSFQWQRNGNNVGTNSPTYSIAALQTTDVGSYTVTATNIAGSVTSAAAQFTLAPPGVNLSLGKVATASSVENPQGTPASAAIDGNLATRWGSSFANAATADTQWITVDLGAVMRFNRIVLRWENAYGKAYQIQVSNDNATWTKAYEQDAGVGGVEDFSFPTQQARYVRMQGITRGTQYGYSLWEFEIYNAANCGVQMGTAPERYTVQSPALVLDNLSGLTWSRSQYTYTDPGTQLTQPLAAQYCSAQGMRLPTKDEAVAISGSNSSSCAFPAAWNTWTSTGVPNQSTLAYTVGSTGALDTGLINNLPGWALCTAGATAAAPVITTQPAAVTAAAGGTAQFNVAATGSTPMAYVWSKNGTAVEETGVPTFTTPVLASTDNGELYSVAVIGGNGLTTESSTALLTVSGTVTPTPTPAPAPSTPNLALGKTATASSTENAANLGASQAVDGNLTTRWGSAFSDPQWIQIDFGSAVTFNQVILRWEAAYGKAYTLQVSSDAVNWTTAYTQTAGAGGTESFTFPAVTGRYVRMLGTARGTQYGYSLYEFEVYGTSAPSITTQPAAQTAVVGATATFSVGAGGTGPFTYQWLENGAPISGATSASYTTGALAAADNGELYTVTVTNAGGSITSQAAALTVTSLAAVPPTITTQLQPQTAAVGTTATFSVSATGTPTVGYQWQLLSGGVLNNIPGATSATYTTPVLTPADNGNMYRVKVRNAAGGVKSQAVTLTVAGSAPPYTVYPGFIGTDLNNNTNGAYADSQVYVTVIGIDPATGHFATVSPAGTITDVSEADNTAPGHLTKNGQSYPNYAFTLAQSKLLKLPQMSSGRIFISLGEPVYLQIIGNGYAGPNPQNTTDPNINVHFDWYEFTYNSSGLYINTTQVDEFGLPLLLDVWGNKATFHQQTGITESIAALDAEYNAETPAAFNVTPSNLRILSPAKTTFGAGGTNGTYFDAYTASVWSYYSTNSMTLNLFGNARRFVGTTQGANFIFTEVDLGNGAYVGNTYTIGEPNTQQILGCNGPLATGDSTNADRNTVELAIEAQFCAAFNRHDMLDPTTWATPSAWYTAAPANFYAAFWHRHSVGGLAYGFAYDDVSGQSSTISTGAPEHMAFGIGW